MGVRAGKFPWSSSLLKLRGSTEPVIVRAATSGDDYEIAFTCSPENAGKVRRAGRRSGTRVTEIGTVEQGRDVVLLDSRGKVIKIGPRGYTHF